MATETTRYNTDMPVGAIILQDRQNLNDMVRNNPQTVLDPENGGYYLKTTDGEVLAITGDGLCVELDAALASVDSSLDSAEDESKPSREPELKTSAPIFDASTLPRVFLLVIATCV